MKIIMAVPLAGFGFRTPYPHFALHLSASKIRIAANVRAVAITFHYKHIPTMDVERVHSPAMEIEHVKVELHQTLHPDRRMRRELTPDIEQTANTQTH